MTQNANDVEIANQGFAAFRQDLNDVLEDITTLHSGTAAPSTTYANQWWYETDTDKLYIRNEDNDAWIEILTLDQANDHLATLGASITLDGTGNVSIDSGDFTVDTDTLYVDSTNNRVGVGTASPAQLLSVEQSNTGTVDALVKNTGTGASADARDMAFVSGASGGDPQLGVGVTGVQDYFWRIDNSDGDNLKLDSNGVTRMTLDTAGNLGIGITNPNSYYAENLVVAGSDEGGITIESASTEKTYLMFAKGTSGQDAYRGYIGYDHALDNMNIVSSGSMDFRTGSGQTDRGGITTGGDFRAREAIQVGLSVGGSYSTGEREVAAFGGANQDYTEIVGRNVADTSHVIAAVIDGGAKFRVTAAGDGFFDGVGDSGPADFAEYFEWDDGNTSDEDRVGYSVVLTNGNKIRKATSNDAASDIIGIVSGRPAFVADTASLGWAGKYETDDYARRIKTDVTYYEWTDSEGEKHAYRADRIPDDVTVPSDAASRIRQEDAISSDYDSSQTYTPRSERQEWDAIGLLGKLSLRVGQPTGDRWIKLRDIATDDDGNVTIEQWLVR